MGDDAADGTKAELDELFATLGRLRQIQGKDVIRWRAFVEREAARIHAKHKPRRGAAAGADADGTWRLAYAEEVGRLALDALVEVTGERALSVPAAGYVQALWDHQASLMARWRRVAADRGRELRDARARAERAELRAELLEQRVHRLVRRASGKTDDVLRSLDELLLARAPEPATRRPLQAEAAPAATDSAAFGQLLRRCLRASGGAGGDGDADAAGGGAAAALAPAPAGRHALIAAAAAGDGGSLHSSTGSTPGKARGVAVRSAAGPARLSRHSAAAAGDHAPLPPPRPQEPSGLPTIGHSARTAEDRIRCSRTWLLRAGGGSPARADGGAAVAPAVAAGPAPVAGDAQAPRAVRALFETAAAASAAAGAGAAEMPPPAVASVVASVAPAAAPAPSAAAAAVAPPPPPPPRSVAASPRTEPSSDGHSVLMGSVSTPGKDDPNNRSVNMSAASTPGRPLHAAGGGGSGGAAASALLLAAPLCAALAPAAAAAAAAAADAAPTAAPASTPEPAPSASRSPSPLPGAADLFPAAGGGGSGGSAAGAGAAQRSKPAAAAAGAQGAEPARPAPAPEPAPAPAPLQTAVPSPSSADVNDGGRVRSEGPSHATEPAELEAHAGGLSTITEEPSNWKDSSSASSGAPQRDAVGKPSLADSASSSRAAAARAASAARAATSAAHDAPQRAQPQRDTSPLKGEAAAAASTRKPMDGGNHGAVKQPPTRSAPAAATEDEEDASPSKATRDNGAKATRSPPRPPRTSTPDGELSLDELMAIAVDLIDSKASEDARRTDRRQPRQSLLQHLRGAYLPSKIGGGDLAPEQVERALHMIRAGMAAHSSAQPIVAIVQQVLSHGATERFAVQQLARYQRVVDEAVRLANGPGGDAEVASEAQYVHLRRTFFGDSSPRGIDGKHMRDFMQGPHKVRDLLDALLAAELQQHQDKMSALTPHLVACDSSGVGVLDAASFMAFCDRLNSDMSDQEIAELYHELDACGSGFVPITAVAERLLTALDGDE